MTRDKQSVAARRRWKTMKTLQKGPTYPENFVAKGFQYVHNPESLLPNGKTYLFLKQIY